MVVASAARSVGCWLIKRLITPKSDSWRDSAMRSPKVGQAEACAAASSSATQALTGTRWSGSSSQARRNCAWRSNGCGSRPSSRETSTKLVSAAARIRVSKPALPCDALSGCRRVGLPAAAAIIGPRGMKCKVNGSQCKARRGGYHYSFLHVQRVLHQ